jgi:predicted RNA binding protein YcfA (HicA-like mRNA interferase family)
VKLPRDLNGAVLARRLQVYGYGVTRQSGDHLRLTTKRNGEHHLTIPRHSVLKPGTLAGILKEVASHLGIAKEAELHELLG